MLFTTLASSAANPTIASRAQKPSPSGITSRATDPRPCCTAASHDDAERGDEDDERRRQRREHDPRRIATRDDRRDREHARAHRRRPRGLSPELRDHEERDEEHDERRRSRNAAKPSRRGGEGDASGSIVRAPRGRRQTTPTTTADAAAVGRSIRTANPPKVNPVAEKTSRLVRFDTGNRPDPAFASCVVTSNGRSESMCRDRTSPITTGVNSTAVASRLITVVTATAASEIATSRRRTDVCGPRDRKAPACSKRPAARTASAITKIDARNTSVGRRRSSTSRASSKLTSPTTTTSTAAGTAASASGTLPHATRPSTAASTITLATVATGVVVPNATVG